MSTGFDEVATGAKTGFCGPVGAAEWARILRLYATRSASPALERIAAALPSTIARSTMARLQLPALLVLLAADHLARQLLDVDQVG
jgi:hypothetical protein